MGGSKKKTQTQTYTPPSWVEGASRDAINIGSRIGSQEYEAYGGDRVAGLSGNERQGIDLASKSAGAFQPYARAAETMIGRGTQSFTDANLTGYMNPYIKSALDPAAREIAESGAREKNRLQSMQKSMKAFGGSRGALLEARANEDTEQAIGDLYKTGLSDAFDRAASLWGADRAREMQGAGQLMDLGMAVNNANKSDIQALMTTGATDRSIQQALKDFDYQQFREERDWDLRNLGGLLAAIQGTQGSYSTTTKTTQETKGNALGQVLGIAGTLIGAFYGGPAGAKAGGEVGGALGGGGDDFSSFGAANDWLEGGVLTAAPG